MACFASLHGVDGERHAGFGLLPGSTHMQRKLAGLGMSPELPEGRLAGHTFHYSPGDPLIPLRMRQTGRPRSEPSIARGASPPYMHFYFLQPEAAARLLLP